MLVRDTGIESEGSDSGRRHWWYQFDSPTAEGQITVSHIAPFAPGGRTRAIRMVPTHAAAHRSLRNCSRITPVSVGLSFSVSGVMLRPGAM
jgi:hypothetical protein